MRAGPRNLITDVEGLLVGNAQDDVVQTGTTVLTATAPFIAAAHVMGGAPGTRETDLLEPDKIIQKVDALVLSGGSALGLAAASGISDALRASGRGHDVAGQKVPIVPSAILFDLLNGGDKNWSINPYPDLGRAALNAASENFDLGSVGAGKGATTANLMGGLGSASAILPDGQVVGALVAVNALGSAVAGESGHFWAAPWEQASEFGGRGVATSFDPLENLAVKGSAAKNTTIAIVATDATLTQAQAKRMATAAHDGMARALIPSHTPMDGDLIFAASTCEKPLLNGDVDALLVGHAAAVTLSRAIARAIFCAEPGILPSWKTLFG